MDTASMHYAPISSVWEAGDPELIERMLDFYPTIPPEPILDSTYNAGRFWKGSNRPVVSMDIDPQYKPDIVGDNRKMDGVADTSFGVVVYDPPHVGPQGRDKSRKRFDVDFGATMQCGKDEDWTLSYLYPPFLAQAKRVLKPEGLLRTGITLTLERIYNPLNVDELGRNAARALICYPLSKLPPPDAFQGCGVYTIHYHGTFPAYTCMGSDEPIYVGKADPPGKRQGRIATAHNKTTLYGRLTHHARSIDSAGNLDLADFTCRWLVLDPVWISLT